MKKVLLLISSCLVLGLEMNAQVVTYENAKKKAQKSFDDAQMAVREYRMPDAIDLLKDAVRQEPGFTDAYGQMTITYVELKKYKEAIINYEKTGQCLHQACYAGLFQSTGRRRSFCGSTCDCYTL
jgi:tetratricopeptide (TPR) repeat protein